MEVQKKHTAFAKEQTKPGYKKTKLGWIPEEWNLKSLDELGDFSKGKGIAKKDVLEDETEGVPCIRYAEIYTLYHYYTESLVSKISIESTEKSNPINYGDILFAGSGETLEDIGKSIAYLGNKTAYAGGDIIILKQNDQNSQYLGYLLNNDVVRNQLFKIGQGHSVVHIYSSGLKKVLVPLPPLPVQQKIASILNTWDKAIAAQEQLIAQKQELKKGLMQALLTGKKRFDGFNEEWEEVRLKDVGEIFTGGTPSSNIDEYWNGDIVWYTPSEIKSAGKYIYNSERKITQEGLNNSSAKLFPEKTIVVCTRATIGEVSISMLQACTNQGFKSIKINQEYDLEFIYYKLKNSKQELIRKSAGSTFLELSTTDFRNFKILVPVINEQIKIARILSSIDCKIETLEKQLEGLKKQKQGLMQQLLTGEKRVKI